MPELKAKIFAAIMDAGDKGITLRELIAVVYGPAGPSEQTIKSHIFAINDLLEETDLIIKSDRSQKQLPHWRLVQRSTIKRRRSA